MRAQKRASKWKRKEHTLVREENKKVQRLNDEVLYLQNENEKMKEKIEEILNGKCARTFHGGRYSDVVREVCYSLLARGVSTRDVGPIIQKILKKFAHMDIKQLPWKSVVSNMLAECEQVGKIHIAKTMLQGDNNTLHLDGTRKRFNEYSAFQLTTGDGSQGLSFGFEAMAAGSTDDYMCATKDLISELAKLLVPKDASEREIEMKQGQLLKTIKNVQSDRHVVNKNYFEQLKIYRASFLPKIIPHFNELSAEEVSKVVRMNQLFCGMHAIIGMANVCKDALKEFENVAASELVTSGFQKGNARSFDILMEISKAFTRGHSYQKGGVVDFWESYLHNKNSKNKIVSFRGERINVLYVIAAAAYYHRDHIKDFLEHDCIQNGKLLQAIRDIGEKIFPASFRALGMIGKLITSPLMRLIEDKEKHIFSLNKTWEHIVTKLESFSANATPLMEGVEIVLEGQVTKDDIYEELMKENEELDDLTEECLRVLCCSCAILLKRQLKDQLPGGKYYKPSDEIMEETAGTPKENIISERDFAQLDRLLEKCPTTSTIAASGIVCFINNKIPEYLENLSEEEKHAIIQCAIQEVPNKRKELQRKKKFIHERKLEQMKEK